MMGEIPAPSAAKRGERVVSVPHSMALKAAVYLAALEAGHQQFRTRTPDAIGLREARRILDPHHPTKLPRIEAALAARSTRKVGACLNSNAAVFLTDSTRGRSIQSAIQKNCWWRLLELPAHSSFSGTPFPGWATPDFQ
jgi:hypothetical protein